MSTESVIYGLWRENSLVVLEEDWAQQMAAYVTAWRAVKTLGEARALLREGRDLSGPTNFEYLDEDFEGEPDDTPWTIDQSGDYNDGDWPPMPGQLMLDWIDEDWELGEVVETVFSGPYLSIEPDEEAELVAALEARGLVFRRDDDLVNRAAAWS